MSRHDEESPERADPKSTLARHSLFAKRHFGQNFLADAHLAARIADLCTSPPGGTVIELGAGLGALTRPLLERAARVIAVERDRDLVPVLHAEFPQAIAEGRLRMQEADAKSVDLAALIGDGPRPHVLAGNLPYQISGPLLERAVTHGALFDRVVFLLQLEVADRLAAQPGDDAYGALSVFAQARFSPRRAFVVRRGAFYPQPRVDSAVVVLEPRSEAIAETEALRQLVHAAFGKRRKKLANAWKGLFGLDAAALAGAAERAGIDLGARGETLDVAAFARMAQEIER